MFIHITVKLIISRVKRLFSLLVNMFGCTKIIVRMLLYKWIYFKKKKFYSHVLFVHIFHRCFLLQSINWKYRENINSIANLFWNLPKSHRYHVQDKILSYDARVICHRYWEKSSKSCVLFKVKILRDVRDSCWYIVNILR